MALQSPVEDLGAFGPVLIQRRGLRFRSPLDCVAFKVQGLRPLWVQAYLWLVGNGRMVVLVVIIVPHSSIPY